MQMLFSPVLQHYQILIVGNPVDTEARQNAFEYRGVVVYSCGWLAL